MKPQFTYEKMDRPEILSFMFQPRPDSGGTLAANAEDTFVEDGADKLHVRYYLTEDNEQPALLFFHGNGEIVGDYDDIAGAFNEHGVSFIAAEYRGYGLSSGTPTATNMINDAHLIFGAVTAKLQSLGFAGKFLVMGRSLGSAPAIDLAASYPDQIKGLLLDSAFAFTIPVLESVGVNVEATGLSEEDCFHNIDKIRTISLPTYMIHGQVDEIIKFNNATELQMESPALQKEFQAVPGTGHNNIFQVTGKMYFEVMMRFINRLGIMRKKKKGVR